MHVSEGEGEHRPVDEFAAIEAIVTWEEFATSIAEAQKLALYSSAASEKSETAASSSSATAQAASLSSQPPSRSGTRYIYIERAVQPSARNGQVLDPELFKFLSPLGWEHINLTGDYQWTGARLGQSKFRPLRTSSHP